MKPFLIITIAFFTLTACGGGSGSSESDSDRNNEQTQTTGPDNDSTEDQPTTLPSDSIVVRNFVPELDADASLFALVDDEESGPLNNIIRFTVVANSNSYQGHQYSEYLIDNDDYSYLPLENLSWLTISEYRDSAIKLNANTTGLEKGTYFDVLTVEDQEYYDGTTIEKPLKTYKVNIIVDVYSLGVDQGPEDLVYVLESTPSNYSSSLILSGDMTDWSVKSKPNWLDINSDNYSSANQTTATLSLNTQARSLQPNSYDGIVTFENEDGITAETNINLTVVRPVLNVDLSSHILFNLKDEQHLSETLMISSNAAVNSNWNAQSNQDWLILNTTSGDLDSGLTITLDSTKIENGSIEHAILTISTQIGSSSITKEIPISAFVDTNLETAEQLTFTRDTNRLVFSPTSPFFYRFSSSSNYQQYNYFTGQSTEWTVALTGSPINPIMDDNGEHIIFRDGKRISIETKVVDSWLSSAVDYFKAFEGNNDQIYLGGSSRAEFYTNNNDNIPSPNHFDVYEENSFAFYDALYMGCLRVNRDATSAYHHSNTSLTVFDLSVYERDGQTALKDLTKSFEVASDVGRLEFPYYNPLRQGACTGSFDPSVANGICVGSPIKCYSSMTGEPYLHINDSEATEHVLRLKNGEMAYIRNASDGYKLVVLNDDQTERRVINLSGSVYGLEASPINGRVHLIVSSDSTNVLSIRL